MNILMAYKVEKRQTYYEIAEGSTYKKVEPEDLPCYISNIVHKVRQSTFVYVRELSSIKEDIIRALYAAGVTFIEGNPKEKNMKPMQCKSLIGGDIPKIYHLTIINHGKKIQFIDLNNLLPRCEEVLASWGEDEDFRMIKAYERALNDLHSICKVARKKPVTVSAATRGLLRKTMPWFRPMDIKDLYIETGEKLDTFIRNTYHGGLCVYKNRDYIEHEGAGICIDVNSMYPWIMRNKPLPMYCPSYFQGEPTGQILRAADKGEKAIFLHLRTSFDLKEKGIPCLRSDDISTENGWLTTSSLYNLITGEITKSNRKIDIYVTYMDYLDFMDNYDIHKIEYVDYVTMDMERPGLFRKIIDPLFEQKKTSEKGYRKMVKIIMNSLSGTVAMRSEYENYAISISESGQVEYKKVKTTVAKSVIYLGAYITSYARHELIKHIRLNYNRWIYSDTDCLFLRGYDIPDDIKIGEELGMFSVDKKFTDIVIYKQKMYGMQTEDGYDFTLAGVKKEDVNNITRVYDSNQVYDELTRIGSKMYKMAKRKEKIVQILEEEYGTTFKETRMWPYPVRPDTWKDDMDRYIKYEKEYMDLACNIWLYKGKHRPSLLDAVLQGEIELTGYQFINFERYFYKYKMGINEMHTYE